MSDIRSGFYLKIEKEQLARLNAELELDKKTLDKLARRAFNYSVKAWVREVTKRLRKETNLDKEIIATRTRSLIFKRQVKAKIFNGLNAVNIRYWNTRKTKRGLKYGKSGNRVLNTKSWIYKSKKGDEVAYERKGGGKIRATYGVNKGKMVEKYGLADAEIDSFVTPILEKEIPNFYKIFEKRFDNEVNKDLKRQLRKLGNK